jgi:hypothetical protein
MNLDHVFIELGLSEDNIAAATVTGIAAVRTDRKGRVLAAYSESCSIRGLEEADIETVYANLSCALLTPYPTQYVVISQHGNAYRGILPPECFRGKSWLDIAQLAWPLGYCDMISNRDLDTLCKHFGIKIAHDAEGSMSGNCEALVRAYWAMMQRYRTALIGEEAVRDFGGEALAGVRKFIGF